MFSKKSFPITIAFILILTLGTMGLAYGAWTDTLHINGNVTTGTLAAELIDDYAHVQDGCTKTWSTDKKTLTLSASNVTPGTYCQVQLEVNNVGTVPLKVNAVNVAKTGADYWFMDCNFNGMTLAPGSFGGECLLSAEIPADNSSMGKSTGITVTVDIVQAP